MASYETMLVTSAKLDEEATAAVVGKFKTLIEANGTIDAVDEWGKRRLAYPINKEEEGIYTLIYFTSDADFPAELDRVYNITDGVLRSMIIARPEGAPLPEAKKTEAQAPAAQAPTATEEAPTEQPAAEEAPAAAEVEAPAVEAAPAEEAAPAAEEAPAEEATEAEQPVAEEQEAE